MSILNYLPTAVVSPIVSVSEPLNVPVSKETKQIKVDSSITVSPKTQFGNDDDWRRNFKDCSCSSSSSLKFVHSAASDCEHPPKKLKCSHSNNFYFPTLSSCTVELTKFKQLDDKIGQSSKSDISTSIEKSRRCIHTDCKNYTSTESDDDNVCLRSWMQKKRNRKDSSGKKRQGFKRKTRISISKQDSFTGIKNSENLTNNLNCVTDNSLQVQHNSLVYIPQPSDILHKFPSNVTVCSLCHLPSNFLPQLGDLFGPYRPSYSEVIDRYKEIHKQYSAANMKSCCTSASKTKEQIRVDQANKTCYIDITSLECHNDLEKTSRDLSAQSIGGSEKVVQAFMPHLRMLQTVDCLLSESNKKPVARFCRNSKSLRVPGFSGKISSTDESLPVYSETNKTLLHDINTVVFVEPTRTISSTDQCNCGADQKCAAQSDSTTVNVVHKFDTSPMWLHGPCAVWTPGIFSVQKQVYGVSAAVRQAADSFCSYCQRSGATIACKFEKGTTYHFLCCLAKGFTLDESTFMAERK